MDCMQGMKEFPDNYFDLAIVDPPYGDAGNADITEKRFGNRFDRYRKTSRHMAKGQRKGQTPPEYAKYSNLKRMIEWDVAPGQDYFDELFRVSKNQIIFGGNYFDLPPTRCFIVWRKTNIPFKFSMSMAEYAWTSFDSSAKVIDCSAQNIQGRFHPTQKPVELYERVLAEYAEPGNIILDTHAGSGSCLVACYDMGFDFVGFEIDPDYYKRARQRLNEEIAQTRIDWRLP